jgi:hypothetical protein
MAKHSFARVKTTPTKKGGSHARHELDSASLAKAKALGMLASLAASQQQSPMPAQGQMPTSPVAAPPTPGM